MGRRAKAPREDLGPEEVKKEVKPEVKPEVKARPVAARRVSGVRGGQAEASGAPVARQPEDRRRVALAGDGAQGWDRRARSGLWNAPCRSTPTATGSSTAMN